MTTHEPVGTAICSHDGLPWPCSVAKKQLVARHTRKDGTVGWTDLKAHMALHLADAAAGSLSAYPGGVLAARFVGWIRLWPGYTSTWDGSTRPSVRTSS